MKKKSLSVKKKNLNRAIGQLKDKKISSIFNNFKIFINSLKINPKKLAVAVSGGPDSLALAYLAKCLSELEKYKVSFYIVDHRLRKNSSDEAVLIKKLLKTFDINSNILVWKRKKPRSNIQSIAREERYDLLKKACAKNREKHLLTGHHIDDLYENFFIRLFRGSGLKGLTSLSELTKDTKTKIYILRPLIYLEKKNLIYVSRKIFNFYIKDPSNKNIFFKRSRIRNLILDMKREGFDNKKLSLTINNLKSSNNSINYYVDKNIQMNSRFNKLKNIYILNRNFFNQSDEVVFRSLAQILKSISNKYYTPRGKSIVNIIAKLKSNNMTKSTLGGCYIEKIKQTVLISREN